MSGNLSNDPRTMTQRREGVRVICKEYGCNLQDTFRLISLQLPWLVDLASLVCDAD